MCVCDVIRIPRHFEKEKRKKSAGLKIKGDRGRIKWEREERRREGRGGGERR